jgi:hypothetical protein
MPFTGTMPLRSGLGNAGVSGKSSQGFCACTGRTPARAISKGMKVRTMRIDVDSFAIGLAHASSAETANFPYP